MSGGKGGSQSTKVEIPAFIESAARENLARAQRTARMGYLPYYGPEVAAFSPMQEQAMRATGGAAEAFGLAGPALIQWQACLGQMSSVVDCVVMAQAVYSSRRSVH